MPSIALEAICSNCSQEFGEHGIALNNCPTSIPGVYKNTVFAQQSTSPIAVASFPAVCIECLKTHTSHGQPCYDGGTYWPAPDLWGVECLTCRDLWDLHHDNHTRCPWMSGSFEVNKYPEYDRTGKEACVSAADFTSNQMCSECHKPWANHHGYNCPLSTSHPKPTTFKLAGPVKQQPACALCNYPKNNHSAMGYCPQAGTTGYGRTMFMTPTAMSPGVAAKVAKSIECPCGIHRQQCTYHKDGS